MFAKHASYKCGEMDMCINFSLCLSVLPSFFLFLLDCRPRWGTILEFGLDSGMECGFTGSTFFVPWLLLVWKRGDCNHSEKYLTILFFHSSCSPGKWGLWWQRATCLSVRTHIHIVAEIHIVPHGVWAIGGRDCVLPCEWMAVDFEEGAFFCFSGHKSSFAGLVYGFV